MALTQIDPSMIPADAIDASKIAAGAVGASEIADGAVGTAELATDAVTQAKVAAGVGGEGPAFSAYLSANQSVSSGVTTRVACDAEEFDTANAFDSTTNKGRFTPQVAGTYLVTAHIGASASTAGTVFVPYIYKNGTAYKVGQSYIPPSGSSSMNGSITALVYLNGSTDYVELWGNNTGSGTNTFSGGASTTWFQGALIRAA